MIRNIVFGGCSYTWGQSLHLFNKSDVKSDTPSSSAFVHERLRYWEYQSNVDRRFPTIVSDYFGRKAKVHTMNIKNCRELNGLLDGINRSAGLMVVTYVSTAWFCSTEVRKEYELIIQAKSIAQRLANGEALGLKPYRSVSVTKEINDRQKEITKEIKTFEKQLKSAEKKLERAKKKSNKKPTEKTVALVEELTQETEGLAYKLNELRAEKRHFNTL